MNNDCLVQGKTPCTSINKPSNKMNIKLILKRLSVALVIASLPVFVQAQPDPGGDPDDTPIPFDGGLSLVIAAGVGYGLKKAHNARKQKEQ